MLPPTLGIDHLLAHPTHYLNKRIAMVCHEASLTSTQIPSRKALLDKGFKLIKLFSPEHGIASVGEDGQYMPNGIDQLTNLPIVSLYGDKLKPSAEDLADVDLVLIDLADIGCRFYTYLWTMSYVLEACSESQTPVLLTDRPNAIGGNLTMAEGPMLDEAQCGSFIGRWNIPLKHSCTLGELGQFFKANQFPNLDLTVLALQGWNRNDADQFSFHPTSPAMQDRSTAYIYPGTGLWEGINVNEGRGTQKPFQQFGAPFMDSEALLVAFEALKIPHITAQAVSYIPTEGFYAQEQCHGLAFTVTDSTLFKPVAFGIKLIALLFQLYPEKLDERFYKTVANPTGAGHMDKLLGVADAIAKLKSHTPFETDIQQQWAELMQEYLLY